jgi:hypothetical protein
MEPVRTMIKIAFSEIVTDAPAKIEETRNMKPDIKKEISVTISVIIRKDQKYLAEALKKSKDEVCPESFFRQRKRPPVRKALIKKAAKQIKTNPPERKDRSVFNTGPRSVNVIRLKPSVSVSVIILDPKAEFAEILRGNATAEIRIRKISQISKTPFHALNERYKPDFNDLKIIMSNLLQ